MNSPLSCSVLIVFSLAGERKKARKKLFKWLHGNGKCLKVERFGKSYTVK